MRNGIYFENLIISFGFLGGEFKLDMGVLKTNRKVEVSCQMLKSASLSFYFRLRLVVHTFLDFQ